MEAMFCELKRALSETLARTRLVTTAVHPVSGGLTATTLAHGAPTPARQPGKPGTLDWPYTGLTVLFVCWQYPQDVVDKAVHSATIVYLS